VPLPEYRWTVVTLGATYPNEVWHQLRKDTGAPYKFVEKFEAEALVKKLRAVQPHAEYRVVPYDPRRR
jgi:hypothetical protein